MSTKKDTIEILQSESHHGDLGIVFTRVGETVSCSIDYREGEISFKLNFIENLLSQQNSYLRSEVEKMKKCTHLDIKPGGKDYPGFEEESGYNQALEDILKMMSEKHE